MTNVTILAALFLLFSGTAAAAASDEHGHGDNGMGDDMHMEVDSGMIDPGEVFSHTFEMAGEFEYHCHPHMWMTASITILPADEDHEPQEHDVAIVEADDQDDWGYNPAHLEIHAGDTVTWTNQGTEAHTVTEDHQENGHNGMGDDHAMGDHDGDPYIPGPGLLFPVLLFGLLLLIHRRQR